MPIQFNSIQIVYCFYDFKNYQKQVADLPDVVHSNVDKSFKESGIK